MAFLGKNELKNILSSNKIITDGDGNSIYSENRIEEAAYALSLGEQVYRTDCKDRKIENLDSKCSTIEINPGQFALLLTKEYVCIPKDKLAFISIKAKQKLKGLVNVSGFHVDPGFEGKLVFSVYNASPSTITLETNKPYFLIWFSELKNELNADDAYNEIKNHHQGQKTIPLDYIDCLKRGDIVSPNELLKQIKENATKITTVEHTNTIKQDKIFWALTLVLGFLTTLNYAFYLNIKDYTRGYSDAIKDTKLDKLIEKGEKYVDDSLFLRTVDSLVELRLKEKLK